ncbi:MAG: hypothetical protein ACLURV_06625 [Gallintestinimicrobium sp.]
MRLLKQMGHFELDDDGDLMAWTAGTEAAPGYYDISLRTLTEYRLEEIREKELLQYKNGKAVLKSILRQVGSDSGKIQILSGENDRIHVNFSDAEGSWYETWKVENDRLVLTDSGEGSVKEVNESGDVSGQTQSVKTVLYLNGKQTASVKTMRQHPTGQAASARSL